MYHDGPERNRAMASTESLLEARPDLAPIWKEADRAFPIRVTSSFAARMNALDPSDPLALQVLPHPSELIDDAERLQVVLEATMVAHAGIQLVLARVTERRMAQVVRKTDCLRQRFVEIQRNGHRPADLRHLE